MGHKKEIIETRDFLAGSHRKHNAKGVSSSIDISQAILLLESQITALAEHGLDTFYISERDLYPYLTKTLKTLLPIPGLVDVEATLKKLSNPRMRTDISIRQIYEIDQRRLENFNSHIFIEMKSVFYEESIDDRKISDDLDKLLECHEKYRAKTFFVLIGLRTEIGKYPSSLLGNPENDTKAFSITTKSGKNIWLMPSGSSQEGELNIFIWAVSPINFFPRGFKSCKYSIFQEE